MKAVPLVLVALAGCEGYDSVGDPFPIAIDTSKGPVLLDVRESDGTTRAAVIDVLAPITVFDADPEDDVRRRGTTLTLLGAGGVPRASFGATITEFHPCPDADCKVGSQADPATIEAIIGADALAVGAARFDFFARQMYLFPDIAGGIDSRSKVCDAVLTRPYFGGGTLSLGGTEVEFTGRRLAVAACLSYDPQTDPDDVTDAGADVLLVVSTGIGTTILSESAYARWRTASGQPDPGVTAGGVWLPSGLVEGRVATIDRMSIVGRDNTRRGPCRINYAHQLMTPRNCRSGDDCPCSDSEDTFCSVPGLIQLAPTTPIDVLVIADEHPLLQSLRAELRPDAAEVDGILGTAALATTSLDIDAPHSRALLRCESGDGCLVRPELSSRVDRPDIERCLALDVVDAGVPDATVTP